MDDLLAVGSAAPADEAEDLDALLADPASGPETASAAPPKTARTLGEMLDGITGSRPMASIADLGALLDSAASPGSLPNAPVPPDIQARLERMEKRLELLEARLDKMASSAGEDMERAAAAAAARILREEMAAVFAEGTA
jgi:hypothetical protein